ncbi:MAG: flagellar motor switch protein FliN [Candidatus Hydrogenedentes bacterium]|nr:flagellar motor switch protein FliN [Candidatus Hydrogenedentota bacterium]
MNAVASTLFAKGFLTGYFDVIGAMLSSKPVFQANAPEDASAENVQDVLLEFPLMMRAAIPGGGGVIMLTKLEDARQIVSAVLGEEPRNAPELADDEITAMKDIFDPSMGGGAGHFKEKYDKVVELQSVEIQMVSTEQSDELLHVLGNTATVVRYSYEVPEIVDGGAALLLFSQAVEDTVPLEALTGESAEDEVEDIVEGRFGAPAVAEEGPSVASREPPGNINMILDIALTVTVRLGRIEMPLGRVLELGPGSIIEVGHSVDEPVELLVNNKLIARGEVVVVEEKFGLRITQIVSPTERIESLR